MIWQKTKQGELRRIARNTIAALHDGAMAGLSFLLSVWLRLGDAQIHLAADYLAPGAALFTALCMATFFSMRLYRGLWRYASLRDLLALTRAVSVAVLLFAALMFFLTRLEGLPRSVLVINWLLLLAMLGGPRFLYRAVKDKTLHWQLTLRETPKIPVLVIGANDAAELFLRESRRDPAAPYRVVGLVDDEAGRIGQTMHGVRIYGDSTHLAAIVRKLARQAMQPQKIVVANQLAGEGLRRLMEEADTLGLQVARLPRLRELQSGLENNRQEVQPIAIEDLLGRPQNVHDKTAMQALVAGRPVLVTGAGGTIGGELSRQLAGFAPSLLVLLELSEYALYQIERELRAAFPNMPLVARLCDVRDAAQLQALMRAHAPALVFHAAAIKHVPIAEENIEACVSTNVLGSKNVADACAALRREGLPIEAMVMISTDKAVNPANVMGATKKLAESYCQALGSAGGQVHYVTVRFGNVLGSTGSVVPLFKEQLAQGGPLTVTHPEMTRYFMTVREAVELVLQAACLGLEDAARHAAIFVLDMGQPVKILELARQLIRLSGLVPEVDIPITFTGLRPGEKLYEELFHLSENAVQTAHSGIFLASPRPVALLELEAGIAALDVCCRRADAISALRELRRLVPEFDHADAYSSIKPKALASAQT